jgi:hypothetical protein
VKNKEVLIDLKLTLLSQYCTRNFRLTDADLLCVQELLPMPTAALSVKSFKTKVSHSIAQEFHWLSNFSSQIQLQ